MGHGNGVYVTLRRRLFGVYSYASAEGERGDVAWNFPRCNRCLIVCVRSTRFAKNIPTLANLPIVVRYFDS